MPRAIDTIIDSALCTGCGCCVEVCPSRALQLRDGRAVAVGPWSIGCGHCVAVCPTGAVSVPSLDPAALQFATLAVPAEVLPPGSVDAAQLLQLMASRRSCRSFRPDVVPRLLLEDLVRAGTLAPSGTNSQRWTFTLLPDRPAVERLAGQVGAFFGRLDRLAASRVARLASRLFLHDSLGVYWREYHETVREALRQWREEGRDRLFHGAPAAILVGSQPGASCPAEDALLATQNILLAAHALGLGSCLIGFAVEAFRHQRGLARQVGLPAGERVHAVVALGYPLVSFLRRAGRRPQQPRILGG